MPAAKHLAPLTPLQQRWTTLYTTTLPQLAASNSTAKAKDKSKWPVTVDHCFARIILDNAVGIDKPWPDVVPAPATRNMTQTQLKACVALGEQIRDGKADLWALDAKSLALRGKAQKSKPTPQPKKRKAPLAETQPANEDNDANPDADDAAPPSTQRSPPSSKKSRKVQAGENWSAFSLLKDSSSGATGGDNAKDSTAAVDYEEAEFLPDVRHIISSSAELSQFRRDVLLLLTQVPRGRYTTYAALSDAVGKLNGRAAGAPGCARAIGMAMRTNPFAPTVPCHRVLASDGKIGGFKGSWGEEGKFYSEKMRLLSEEGVRFDANGKVVGAPFRSYVV